MTLHGYVDEISRSRVVGWAVDTDQPNGFIEVAILVDGLERVRLVADRLRLGLRTLFPGVSGYQGFEFKFTPAITSATEIAVVFAANRKVLSCGSKVLSAETVPALEVKPALLPIAVNGLGRSGTTLLMAKLLNHQRIVGARAYPFELKLVIYYSMALHALTSRSDRKRSTDPDTMADNGYFIGFNPFNDPAFYRVVRKPELLEEFFSLTTADTLRETFRNLISGYYELIRADLGRTSARYFAEKLSVHGVTRKGARRLFGEVREIMLVRDPRDLLCSMKAFWHMSIDSSLVGITAAYKQLLALHSSGASDVLFVRYEDLVLQPERAMESIYGFLDLELGLDSGGDLTEATFTQHATSESPAASIGRWRHELEPRVIASVGSELRTFMEVFDYHDI